MNDQPLENPPPETWPRLADDPEEPQAEEPGDRTLWEILVEKLADWCPKEDDEGYTHIIEPEWLGVTLTSKADPTTGDVESTDLANDDELILGRLRRDVCRELKRRAK